MVEKHRRKAGGKPKVLPTRGLAPRHNEPVKGGKRIVLFLVPPKEISAK